MAIIDMIAPYYVSTVTKDNWKAACEQKRANRDALIPDEWRLAEDLLANLPSNVINVPRECGILTSRDHSITELDDVDELLRNIHSGKWSSADVITAYSKRAVIAHQLTNCLTELWLDEAMERAKELDAHLAKHGTPVGPLHGLPVSLKAQFDIKGRELNMGYAAYLGRISPEDSAIVKCLLKAGAVLYVQTNVPQSLMVGETNNWVYGRTCNPYNNQLTCGGSSGGEGALIALKGSPVGLGTDIGGSVRIPANFNGLFGFRPSMCRMPYGGSTNSFLGQENIFSVIGPLSRSISGCTTVFKAVLEQNPADYDPYAIPLPFRADLVALEGKKDKLCFGVAKWNNVIMPSPPVLRAIEETKAALLKAGHEVVEYSMEGYERGTYLLWNILAADGAEDANTIIGAIDEPWVPEMEGIKSAEVHTVFELYQLNREKEALRKKWLDQWLDTAGRTSTGRPIDGLIIPAAGWTAARFTQNDDVSYTGLFNLLDLPVTVFPTGVCVDPAKDAVNKSYTPISDLDAAAQKRYDPELMKGSPVGLQVVGRRYQCETTLGLAGAIHKALRA